MKARSDDSGVLVHCTNLLGHIASKPKHQRHLSAADCAKLTMGIINRQPEKIDVLVAGIVVLANITGCDQQLESSVVASTLVKQAMALTKVHADHSEVQLQSMRLLANLTEGAQWEECFDCVDAEDLVKIAVDTILKHAVYNAVLLQSFRLLAHIVSRKDHDAYWCVILQGDVANLASDAAKQEGHNNESLVHSMRSMASDLHSILSLMEPGCAPKKVPKVPKLLKTKWGRPMFMLPPVKIGEQNKRKREEAQAATVLARVPEETESKERAWMLREE